MQWASFPFLFCLRNSDIIALLRPSLSPTLIKKKYLYIYTYTFALANQYTIFFLLDIAKHPYKPVDQLVRFILTEVRPRGFAPMSFLFLVITYTIGEVLNNNMFYRNYVRNAILFPVQS